MSQTIFRPFQGFDPVIRTDKRVCSDTEGLYWEDQYLENLFHCLRYGNDRVDRTGDGTRSIFAPELRVDLQQAYPLVTTKKMGIKTIIEELFWFIGGKCNERDLAEALHGTRDPSKTTIWTANANADYWLPKATHEGDLGRVYGVQWRTWTNSRGEVTDQLANVIERLKTDPACRRMIVTAWNPGELDQMALPPCHMFMQFHVDFYGDKKYLNLSMVMR